MFFENFNDSILLKGHFTLLSFFFIPIIFFISFNNKFKYRLIVSYFLTTLLLWIIFFIFFVFKISDSYLIYVFYLIYLIFFLKIKNSISKKLFYEVYYYNILILAAFSFFFILIIFNLNFFIHLSKNYIFEQTFWYWDGLQVWNKSAMNLYNNQIKDYQIYPILYPSQWALIYKIQDNNQIWFISKLSLFIFPIIIFFQSLSIFVNKKYNKNEKKFFLIFFILIILFFSNSMTLRHIFSGYMDSILTLYFLIALYFMKIYKVSSRKIIYFALLIASLSTLVKQTGFILLLIVFIEIIRNERKINIKYLLFLLIPFSYYFFIWFLNFNFLETYLQKAEILRSHSTVEKKIFVDFFKNSFLSFNIIYVAFLFLGILLKFYLIIKKLKKQIIDKELYIIFFVFLLTYLNYKTLSYDNRHFYLVHALLIYLSALGVNDILKEKYYLFFFKKKILNFLLDNRKMIFFKPIYLGLIFLFIYSVFIFSYIKNNENYSLNNQNLFEFHNKKLLTLGNLDLNRFIIQNYNKKKIIITSYDYLTHIPYMHSKIILCRKKDCDSILTKYLTGDKNDAFLIFEEKFLPTNLNYFNLEIVDKYEGYIFFANKKIIN